MNEAREIKLGSRMKYELVDGHKVSVWDNGPKVNDRYTVVDLDYIFDHPIHGKSVQYLGMNDSPFLPNGGVALSGDMPLSAVAYKGRGGAFAKRISFSDLPPDCQKAAKQWLHEDDETLKEAKDKVRGEEVIDDAVNTLKKHSKPKPLRTTAKIVDSIRKGAKSVKETKAWTEEEFESEDWDDKVTKLLSQYGVHVDDTAIEKAANGRNELIVKYGFETLDGKPASKHWPEQLSDVANALGADSWEENKDTLVFTFKPAKIEESLDLFESYCKQCGAVLSEANSMYFDHDLLELEKYLDRKGPEIFEDPDFPEEITNYRFARAYEYLVDKANLEHDENAQLFLHYFDAAVDATEVGDFETAQGYLDKALEGLYRITRFIKSEDSENLLGLEEVISKKTSKDNYVLFAEYPPANEEGNEDFVWEDFIYNFQSLLDEINPDESPWHVDGKNLDWRGRNGYMDLDSNDAQTIIRRISPNGADCTYRIFTSGKKGHFRIMLYHHDVPTGSVLDFTLKRKKELEESKKEELLGLDEATKRTPEEAISKARVIEAKGIVDWLVAHPSGTFKTDRATAKYILLNSPWIRRGSFWDFYAKSLGLGIYEVSVKEQGANSVVKETTDNILESGTSELTTLASRLVSVPPEMRDILLARWSKTGDLSKRDEDRLETVAEEDVLQEAKHGEWEKVLAGERGAKSSDEETSDPLASTSKMPGKSWSLPAGETCPVGCKLGKIKGSVCSDCYAQKRSYTWGPAKIAQHRRLTNLIQAVEGDEATREAWIDAMVKAIKTQETFFHRQHPNEPYYFRLHDSGDFGVPESDVEERLAKREKVLSDIVELVKAKDWENLKKYMPKLSPYMINKLEKLAKSKNDAKLRAELRWAALKVVPRELYSPKARANSETYLKMWIEVAKRLPDVLFWVPTKEYALLSKYKAQLPDNMTIRVSALKRDAVAPDIGFPTSAVKSRGVAECPEGSFVCPAPHTGGECRDCRACWDKNVPIVCYPQH